MHRSQFARIQNHPLREILLNAASSADSGAWSKSQLRAELNAALPDAPADVIDALVVKTAEIAKAAVDPGARWDLRASADRLTLHVIDTLEADDRLVPVEDTEPEDVASTLKYIDGYDPTQRPVDPAARQAADIESAKRLASS
jgi:hypothetical protein